MSVYREPYVCGNAFINWHKKEITDEQKKKELKRQDIINDINRKSEIFCDNPSLLIIIALMFDKPHLIFHKCKVKFNEELLGFNPENLNLIQNRKYVICLF